jgi:UPF0755 protein
MIKKRSVYFLTVALLSVCLAGLWFYLRVFGVSIYPRNGDAVILIPDGARWLQVKDSLSAHLDIGNINLLEWVSLRKHYPQAIRPGRYVVRKGISCNQLINILRGGRQSPVTVTFNNIRTLYDLAGRVGGQIEADSSELIAFLADTGRYSKDGFSRDDVISVFIPDSYEFFWNTGADGFYRKMLKEYRKFWTDERSEKAKGLGLTRKEVSVLASIVREEATRSDEKPRIAGVYINRLRRGIPLQADPTVKFAVNNFTISRVLKKHLLIDSPYNTYIYQGLPPGPIDCPSAEDIDAVLNAEKHDYLFFVAKADLSGYHNFSRTLGEHNRYASEYQRELNRRRIFR